MGNRGSVQYTSHPLLLSTVEVTIHPSVYDGWVTAASQHAIDLCIVLTCAPETREVFSKIEDASLDECDSSERQQVVLTDYGCNKVFADEVKASSAIWALDIDSQEIRNVSTLFTNEMMIVSVINHTNCEVVSPLLFEWTVQVNFVELTNHERRRENQNQRHLEGWLK